MKFRSEASAAEEVKRLLVGFENRFGFLVGHGDHVDVVGIPFVHQEHILVASTGDVKKTTGGVGVNFAGRAGDATVWCDNSTISVDGVGFGGYWIGGAGIKVGVGWSVFDREF